jgi:hypothetical protein
VISLSFALFSVGADTAGVIDFRGVDAADVADELSDFLSDDEHADVSQIAAAAKSTIR